METTESIKIIEQMLKESKQSKSKVSFHFILWSALLIPCGIIEWYFDEAMYNWICWPIAGALGFIFVLIFSSKQSKNDEVKTISGRIAGYIWSGFGICMLVSIFYSISNNLLPHTLILLLAGGATFSTGGLLKFKPLIIGGIFLIVTSIISGFLVEVHFQSLILSLGLFGGYLVPGIILRKAENE